MFKGKPVLRPLRREAAQARQVKKPRQQVVFGPARNLFAQTRPFVRIDPGRPIGALIAAPAFLKHDIGKPAAHGPPDQPSVLAVAQILILRNSLTERDDAAVYGRVALVDAPACQMGGGGPRPEFAVQDHGA